MSIKYDYLIITNLPAFYKINLYNEISKNQKIKVVYLGQRSNIRDKDFVSAQMNFEHEYLNNGELENRNKIKSIFKMISIIKKTNYKKILIGGGGWGDIENWMAIFIGSKPKNALVLESSIYESKTTGLKGLMKKIFLRRISFGYVSGEDQKKLLEALGFKGKTIKTYGVGIMNFEKKPERKHNFNQRKKFLYVGRLSKEKNIKFLIDRFNELNYELGIVGSGPEEEKLKE